MSLSASPALASIPALTRAIDRFALLCGQAVAWLIVPMVLSLVYEVVARYFFNMPTVWAYDMTFILYGSFFMLGSAYTLMKKGHIRTDSLYAGWSPRRQGLTDAICYLVFFFPSIVVFSWLGWEFFWKSFQQGERFVTSPWMPVAWPLKFMIPAAGVLLVIQGISEVLKSIYAAVNNAWPERIPQAAGDALPRDLA
jgi:TRAP-type mannitol/chloroaromatic compound transport system permease small subunit